LNESVNQETAYKILAYLYEHQNAGDNVDGISEWWLMEQRIKSEIATVEKALQILEETRLVIKSQTGVYRINPAKIGEIQELLNEASN
jgi:predicted transcriptional regulator